MVLKFKTVTNISNFCFIIQNIDYTTKRTLLYVGWVNTPDYFEKVQIKKLDINDKVIMSRNFLKRYLRYKHDF